MGITATGLSTGLDVEGIVASLVLADTQPSENRLNNEGGKVSGAVTLSVWHGKRRIKCLSNSGKYGRNGCKLPKEGVDD